MTDSLPWYMDLASHGYTNLLGAAVPISIFWEAVLPPANANNNMVLELFEGVFAVVGFVMMATMVAHTLNPPQEYLSSSAPGLVLVPLFMPSALAKLRRWTNAIRDLLSPWQMIHTTPADE